MLGNPGVVDVTLGHSQHYTILLGYVNSENGRLANHHFGSWNSAPFHNYMFQV
jgi:hypothetical protein